LAEFDRALASAEPASVFVVLLALGLRSCFDATRATLALVSGPGGLRDAFAPPLPFAACFGADFADFGADLAPDFEVDFPADV